MLLLLRKNIGSLWVLGKASKSKVLLSHHLLELFNLSLPQENAQQTFAWRVRKGWGAREVESSLCQDAGPTGGCSENKHGFELALPWERRQHYPFISPSPAGRGMF